MEINGQVIILIIFVVISGVQWLIKKVQGQGEEPEFSESLEDIYDEYRDEIRKRQTAVQPHEPPPLINRQTPQQHAEPEVFHPPVSVSIHPPVETNAYDQAELTPYRIEATNPILTSEQKEAAKKFEQLSRKKLPAKKSAQASIRSLLSDPKSARNAVILHEIFEKPKSMQSY